MKAIGIVLAAAILATALVTGGAGAAAGETAAASATKSVNIKNFAFRPKTLTVSRGTTVRFKNSDRARHTATRRGGFDTGIIRSGRSATVRFKRKGRFGYICDLHPFMKGTIVVK